MPSATQAQPGETRQSYRVLVVDDSAVIRKVIKSALSSRRVEVDTADSGKEAVGKVFAELATNTPYDLVFMDAVMPGLSGLEATHRLREVGYRGKIVICTANREEYDMATSLCSGADDFLPKPFGPEDLLRVLRENCPVPGTAPESELHTPRHGADAA